MDQSDPRGSLFEEKRDEEATYRLQVDQLLKEHQKRLQNLQNKQQGQALQFQLSAAFDPSQVATQEVYLLRCLLNQSLRAALAGNFSGKNRSLFLSQLLNEIALKRGMITPLSCVRNALIRKQTL